MVQMVEIVLVCFSIHAKTPIMKLKQIGNRKCSGKHIVHFNFQISKLGNLKAKHVLGSMHHFRLNYLAPYFPAN